MRCPYCDNEDTRVTNSRPILDKTKIRRRRECDQCGARFTTHETHEPLDRTVQKRNGRVVPFEADRLLKGIRLACEKTTVSEERVLRLAREVERQAYDEVKEKEPVKASRLGELVLVNLKEQDRVAYMRFASVYKKFSDLNDFQGEIKKLQDD